MKISLCMLGFLQLMGCAGQETMAPCVRYIPDTETCEATNRGVTPEGRAYRLQTASLQQQSNDRADGKWRREQSNRLGRVDAERARYDWEARELRRTAQEEQEARDEKLAAERLEREKAAQVRAAHQFTCQQWAETHCKSVLVSRVCKPYVECETIGTMSGSSTECHNSIHCDETHKAVLSGKPPVDGCEFSDECQAAYN